MFIPGDSVSDSVVLTKTSVRRSDLELEKPQVLNSGAILKRSPMEMVNIQKYPALIQLATKVNVVADIRWDGEGVLSGSLKGTSKLAPGIRVARKIVYSNMEKVRADFSHIDPQTLDKFTRTHPDGIELTKWDLSFYWIQSKDGKAFRIFMDQPRFLDHMTPEASEADKPAEPIYALAVFSYRYPIPEERRLHITSVIFDMTIKTKEGVYVGRRQSSGWLPLQPNTKDGPYGLQIGIIEASNFQSFFERLGGSSGITNKLLDKVF